MVDFWNMYGFVTGAEGIVMECWQKIIINKPKKWDGWTFKMLKQF